MTDAEMEDLADEIAHDVVPAPEDDEGLAHALEQVALASQAAIRVLVAGGTKDEATAAALKAVAP